VSIDPDALFERFRQLVEPVLSPEYRVAVAYSGGLDSTVLLLLFARLRAITPFQLTACHVHHGLSPHAEDWQRHCAEQCARLSIPFRTERVDLAVADGEGVEARARHARYAVFERLPVDSVVMAHHRDDQAETVLYRLARGAALRGAAGMPARRRLGVGPVQLWRPLLAESRNALQAYAEQHQAVWICDESNASTAYDRNYLRHEVLPRLYARFPAAATTIARTATRLAEAAELVDVLAEIDAGGWCPQLALDRLVGLSEARQRNVLQWFLGRHGIRPESKQLALLLDQLLTAKQDANPCLRLADVELHRFQGALWVACHMEAPGVTRLVDCPHELAIASWGGVLRWQPASLGVAPDTLREIELRPRMGGEALRLRPDGPTKAVKALFQEAGIPPWLRKRWPLLWWRNELIAVPGVGVAAAHQVLGGLWPRWQPEDWPEAP